MPSSASPTPVPMPLSLHDALPIWSRTWSAARSIRRIAARRPPPSATDSSARRTCPRPRRCSPSPRRTTSPAPPTSPPSASACGRSRSEEHTSELQSLRHLVCRLLLRPLLCPCPFPYTTLFRSGRGHGPPRGPSGVSPRADRRHPPRTPPLDAPAPGRGAARRHREGLRRRHRRLRHLRRAPADDRDRKSTRLNSSHLGISYAVFCFAHSCAHAPFPTRRSSDLVEDMVRREVHQAYRRAQTAAIRHGLLRSTHLPQAEALLAVTEKDYVAGTADFATFGERLRTI